MNNNITRVSFKNWDNRIKTIQTQIKNKYKKFSSLNLYRHKLNECIIEIQSDNEIVIIDNNKYKEIRKYLLSDEFNN